MIEIKYKKDVQKMRTKNYGRMRHKVQGNNVTTGKCCRYLHALRCRYLFYKNTKKKRKTFESEICLQIFSSICVCVSFVVRLLFLAENYLLNHVTVAEKIRIERMNCIHWTIVSAIADKAIPQINRFPSVKIGFELHESNWWLLHDIHHYKLSHGFRF